jgi:hypothetical protein
MAAPAKQAEDPMAAFNPQPTKPDPMAAFNPQPTKKPDISGNDLKALDPQDIKTEPWYTRAYKQLGGDALDITQMGTQSWASDADKKFSAMRGGKLSDGDYMLLGAGRVLDAVIYAGQLAYRAVQGEAKYQIETATGSEKLARDLISGPDAFAGMPHFAAGHALGKLKVTGGVADVADLNLHYDAMRKNDIQTFRGPGRDLTPAELMDAQFADPTAPFPQGSHYEALAPQPDVISLPPKSPYAAYTNVDKLKLTIGEWQQFAKDNPGTDTAVEYMKKSQEAQSWLDAFLKDESGSLNIGGLFVKTEEEPEKVTFPAMRAPTGEVETGGAHFEASQKLEDAGHDGFGGERGYATNKRPFVPEAEAVKIAEDQKQIKQNPPSLGKANAWGEVRTKPVSEDINFFKEGKATPPEADLSKLSSDELLDASKSQRERLAGVQERAAATQTGEETPPGSLNPDRAADKVRVHVDPDTMLEHDRQVNNHRPAVSLAASDLGKAVLGKDFDNTMTGQELYKAIADKLGPEATSQMFAKAGIGGLKVDGGHYVFDSRVVEPRVVDGQPVIANAVPPKPKLDPATVTNRTVTDVKGNILLDRITASDNALEVMEKAAVENDGFAAERAGKASDASITEAARMTGLPAEDIAKHGLFKNDSVLRSVFQAMVQSATDWAAKGKAFVNKNDFDSLKAVVEGRLRHSYIQGVLTGKLAEAGRTLAVVKEFYNTEGKLEERPLALPPNARATLEQLKKTKEDAGLKATEANQKVAEAETAVKEAEFGDKTKANQAVKVAKRAAKTATDDAKAAVKEHDDAAAKITEAQPEGSLAEFKDTVKDEVTLEEWLKKNTGESLDDVKKMAKDVSEMDADKLVKYATKAKTLVPPTFGQRFEAGYRSLWMNFLLSNPLSHIKYAMSMEAMFTFDNLSAIVGGAVRPQSALEGIARFIAQGQSIKEALVGAGDAIKDDRYIQLPSEIKYDKLGNPIAGIDAGNALTKEANSIKLPGVKEVAQVAAGAVTAPIRVIRGIHSFYALRGYRAELNAFAVRAAMKDGFRPWEGGFWEKVQEHAANPYTDAMKGATDAAEKNAQRLTFTSDLGETGKKWSATVKSSPVGFILDPFTHVPVNIAKEGVRLTPGLNMFSPTVRANLLGTNGTIAQSTEVGHFVLGGALAYTGVQLTLAGQSTGDGPTDPSQHAVWALDHKRNSVAIGDQWWSYQHIGPLGIVLGLSARAAEAGLAVYQAKDEPDHERMENDLAAAGYTMMRAFGTIVDEAGLQSIGEVLAAMDDPSKSAARWMRSTVAETVPFTSFAGAVAASMDPYVRRVDSMYDAILNKLPEARQTLSPQLDRLGRLVPNPRYGIIGGILPHSPINHDPLIGEMQRLDIAAAPMAKHISGVLMTPEQQNELQSTFGETAASLLDDTLHTPGWRAEPDFARKEFIGGMLKSARETATNIMRAKYPEQFINQPAQNTADVIQGTRSASGFHGMFPEAPK